MDDGKQPELVTHEVFNQSKPLENYNLFKTNQVLMDAVVREGAPWALSNLTEFGEYLGRKETGDLAQLANKHEPVLHSFDRFGNRIDEVEFHPAWHAIMSACIAQGVHSAPWSEPKAGAHVARAAGGYMHAEIECGSQCPTTMTYGSVPSISKRKDLAQIWLPKIFSRKYDQRFLPVTEKTGALIGMGMTEKQGGSDVRMNTTRATLVNADTQEYEIVGHKWFFSAPMCDAFLVLAQTTNGLSCMFMPRWLPDGTLNKIRIQRLKSKVGNRSNASSEVEFVGARAWLLGEEGRGVPTIIDMATYTRLDCAVGSAGLMHQALTLALNHANQRVAFKRKLVEHPLMTNVLADLCLEVEAATCLAMRTARAFDRQEDDSESDFRRIVTPAAKFWICKRGPTVGAEAMEVLGGNGFVEENSMGRIYREMPLNSIWEGSGNVMCLDVMRALSKSKQSFESVRAEYSSVKGANKTLDQFIASLEKELLDLTAGQSEIVARRVTEKLAISISAALLVKNSPNAVSDAYCSSRLAGDWGHAFGTLNKSCDVNAIVNRWMPIEHELPKAPKVASK